MLEEKFRQTIKRFGLLDKNDAVVVAVSGGPDSLCLLYLLKALSKELNLRLHIAHFDHMLRDDSRLDAEFVKQLALKLNAPFSIARERVRKNPGEGGIEEAARQARIGFLCRVAESVGADKVALGHNLNDQAETVLMRLFRGSGLYGLSAITPKRMINNCCFIRPLLEIKRSDIERFLNRKKIKPRKDLSNAKDIYLRNKIRNRLLPLLKRQYNPRIEEVLANTAGSLAYDYDFLNRESEKQLSRIKKNLPQKKTQSIKIPLNRFLGLHKSMRRMIIRNLIFSLKGNTRRIDYRHIREIEDLVSGRPDGSVVDLPGRISVIKNKLWLIVGRGGRFTGAH